MERLAIGTRVRLSEVGMDRYLDSQYNPHDEVGKVFDNDNDFENGMCYRVKWSGGETNCYYRSDLKVLPKLEENE